MRYQAIEQQRRWNIPSDAGQSLDLAIRLPLEAQLGFDLSRVRIHHDAAAAAAAHTLGAAAFTWGQHLYFGAQQYAPHTSTGRRLLAHELSHVAQQAVGVGSHAGAALEADAERSAAHIAAGGFARPRRLPAGMAHPMLQCYRVPGTLRCNQVVDWLNRNSPYAPEWAQTECTYVFEGGLQTNSETLRDGRVRVSVRGSDAATVMGECPIDQPEWEPSERPNREAEVAAWRAMRVALDAHEHEHRRIGERWRRTLERRYRAVRFSVTGADESDAISLAQDRVAALQQQWTADAQAAQDAIDPFRGAQLACP